MKPTQIAIPSSFTSTATTILARLANRVELVYTPHDRWPLPSNPPSNPNPIRISVLDSSFNPPTLAHHAIATATPPSYHARLLLLSIRNADKSLKPGDASYIQRLEMMYLLAKDIHSLRPNEDAGAENSNVAIAIIDEPTFIGKSTTLLAFLRSRLASFHQPPPTPKLTFLLGTDTLERLFSPRYYPSEESMLTSLRYFFGESEGSTVVCARRDPRSYPGGGTQPTIPHLANEFLRSNQITLIDIGDEEQGYSSAQVRRGRQLQQQGGKAEGWKKFVSWRVGRYIEERGLYSESE